MAQRRATGKQTLTRLSRDFLIQHPKAAGLFEVELFLTRVGKETELLGADGTTLKKFVSSHLDVIKSLRAQNQDVVFEGEKWKGWRVVIEAIRENPLDPEKSMPQKGKEPPSSVALDGAIQKVESQTGENSNVPGRGETASVP
jgi:hypothetical protein